MQGSFVIGELPEIEKLSIYDIDILQKLDSLNDELSASYLSYKFQEIAGCMNFSGVNSGLVS